MMHKNWLLLGVAMVGVLHAQEVSACSAPLCWPQAFVPAGIGNLPANAHAVWWLPGRDPAGDAIEASELHFTCTSIAGVVRNMRAHQGPQRPESAWTALIVDDAFAVGDQCEIAAVCDDPDDDQDAGVDDLITYATFTITEPAAAPDSLALNARAAAWWEYAGEDEGSGACVGPSHYVCEGSVRVDLRPADIAPWAAAIVFEARVDDGAWRRLTSNVVSLTPGSHTVTMRALMPDDSFTIESETQSFTIANCTTPSPDHDAGVDGGATIDGGAIDHDASPGDSGPSDGAGCSCSVVSPNASVSFVSAVWCALLFAFVVRRRVAVRARRLRRAGLVAGRARATRWLALTALAFAASIASFINDARACSGPQCSPDYFLPFDGALPANAPGIRWIAGHNYDPSDDAGDGVTDASDLTFRCSTADGAPRDVAFHVDDVGGALLVDAALTPADECEIASTLPLCDFGAEIGSYLSGRARFVVGEPASMPTTLGVLAVDEVRTRTVRIATDAGSCDFEVAVCGVAIDVALSEQARPWADALSFTTLVDGLPWGVAATIDLPNVTGGSFVGRGKDLVFVATDETESRGLAQGGVHKIWLRATLPGTDVMIETASIDVMFDCAGSQDASDGGFICDSSVADETHDASAADGPWVCDANVDADTSDDARKVDQGCSCSVVRPNAPLSWMTTLWCALLLAFVALRASRVALRSPRARG